MKATTETMEPRVHFSRLRFGPRLEDSDFMDETRLNELTAIAEAQIGERMAAALKAQPKQDEPEED